MDTNDLSQRIIEIAEAYNEHDYDKSAELSRELVKKVPNLTAVQILLISLQRLGRTEEVNQVAPQLIAALSDSSWSMGLLELTLGQTSAEEILTAAETVVHECQARYYAGERLATLDEYDAARAEFEVVAKSGVPCNQVMLAIAALQTPWRGS